MESQARRRNADRLLYEMGLLDMLREIGTPHVTGSYQMDMMAWNDLDVNIENEGMTLTKLYRLTGRILETFRPSWYEAKEERTPEGKIVWFHGFEAMVGGGLWNVDLWFFDQETIAEAERYGHQPDHHPRRGGFRRAEGADHLCQAGAPGAEPVRF